MRPRLSVSRSAIELIKAFEGYRAKAARLDDGRWTIGYGHTLTAREGAKVSEPDAEALLLYDLISVTHAINELIYAPLNQNQFDALASFVFNIGVRNFRGSVTYRRLNEGRFLEAALSMGMWRKSDLEGERIIIDALVRRRSAELALFMRPMEGFMPAPSPVLPPKFDYDALGVMPMTSPVATRAPLGGERAFAERDAEPPAAEPPESPSASQAAAEAVIARLETILAEPDATPEPAATSGGQSAETPASASVARGDSPAAATAGDVDPAVVLSIMPARPRKGAHPLLLVGLGLIGVGLFVAAALWGFAPEGAQALGLPAPWTGLALGGAGLICFLIAIYFLLDRLGRPPERRR
jgi:lysozyme